MKVLLVHIIIDKWGKKKGYLHRIYAYGSKTVYQIQTENGTYGNKSIKLVTYFTSHLPENTEWHLQAHLQVFGHNMHFNAVLCFPGVFFFNS